MREETEARGSRAQYGRGRPARAVESGPCTLAAQLPDWALAPVQCVSCLRAFSCVRSCVRPPSRHLDFGGKNGAAFTLETFLTAARLLGDVAAGRTVSGHLQGFPKCLSLGRSSCLCRCLCSGSAFACERALRERGTGRVTFSGRLRTRPHEDENGRLTGTPLKSRPCPCLLTPACPTALVLPAERLSSGSAGSGTAGLSGPVRACHSVGDGTCPPSTSASPAGPSPGLGVRHTRLRSRACFPECRGAAG